MIFCSYYGNLRNLLKNVRELEGRLVSISLGGFSYSSVKFIQEKEVMVDRGDFFEFKNGKMIWEEYCLSYYEKLNKLDDNFWNSFVKRNSGKILFCYEKNLKECHRYLLGKFLYWKFGKCMMVEVDDKLKFWKIEKTVIKV